MKKANLAKALAPFVFLGSPAVANTSSHRSNRAGGQKAFNVSAASEQSARPVENDPFSGFGSVKASQAQAKSPKDVLSFLQGEGLLNGEVSVNKSIESGDINARKVYASSCQVSFGCTTAYGSQASCEAGPGPGVWFPDTDDCTAAAPDPDINLRGNGQSIVSGTTALSAGNHTDFGTHVAGGANMTRTFTIECHCS